MPQEWAQSLIASIMIGSPIREHHGPDSTGSVYYARAKVNLTLKILGRREDGLHELESIVVFASNVCDRLLISPSKHASLETSGPFAPMLGEDNLVLRALEKVSTLENDVRLAAMVLEKNIPVAAGLGGGSADAGAALRMLADLNPHLLDSVDWREVAVSLGADVPVCLESRAAFMRGIGEQVTRIDNMPFLFAVLVNAQEPPPLGKTARVFAMLGAAQLNEPMAYSDKPALLAALSNASRETVMRHLGGHENDLEAPAMEVMPEIAKVKRALEQSGGCQLARLSGAGPTCFGLYPSKAEAENACAKIQKAEPSWWVVATEFV